MRSFKWFSLLSALTILTLFSSCKKDEKSNTELLTQNSWKITAITMSPAVDFDNNGVPDSDLFVFFENCDKDDVFNFKSDNSIDIDAGSLKCSPLDPQVSDGGSWAWQNNETAIKITEPDNTSYTYTVAELNDSSFKVTVPGSAFDLPLPGVVLTITFQAQ